MLTGVEPRRARAGFEPMAALTLISFPPLSLPPSVLSLDAAAPVDRARQVRRRHQQEARKEEPVVTAERSTGPGQFAKT